MLINLLLLTVCFVTLFTSFKNIKLSKSSISNLYLGLFIISFMFSILYVLAVKNLSSSSFNIVILLPFNLILLPIYLILQYINQLLNFSFFSKKLIRICLLLAGIELCSYLMPLGAWLYTQNIDRNLIAFTFSIKHYFMFLAFCISVFVIVHGVKCINKQIISTYTDQIRMKWVKHLLIYLSLLLAIVLLPEFAYLIKEKSFIFYILQCIVGGVIVNFIGIKNLILQKQIRVKTLTATDNAIDTSIHFKKITQIFIEEKVYQNPELRVSDVAEMIHLSPNYVSKIINENTNASFNDFINEYRIKEIIEKFEKREHLHKNIVALAKESGFNSKSTFQSVFKKKTGKTPTQYIKEQMDA